MAGPWEAFQQRNQSDAQRGPWSAFAPTATVSEQSPGESKAVSAPPAQEGFLANAAKPITSYPETYSQMVREAGDLVGEGIDQVKKGTVGDVAVGALKTGLGGIGYVASPINAALRTVVGKPIEDITGAPKEYTEFAASLALPLPKRIPLPAKVEAKAAPKAAPTTEQLFEAADEGYKAARASKFQMSPEATTELQNGIKANLSEAGYRDFLTPKTFRAIDELKLDGPSNVADIEAVRRALNIASKDPAEKDAARRAIMAIDERLSAAVPEIAAARGNYAAASRAETIEEASQKAALQAKAANSGQNIDNATRQQFKAILNSPAKRRGFSANELAQMEVIVGGSKPGNAARFAGNLLGGGGGLGSVVTAGVGGLATGGIGAVAPVFGYAFKKLGNKLTSDQVVKLEEMVRARSPLGQSVGASVKDWSEAAQAFELSPTVKNFVRMSVASRNLSNNMKGAGIQSEPNQLVQSLMLPASEGEQQEQGRPE